jgi:hypothetical protein
MRRIELLPWPTVRARLRFGKVACAVSLCVAALISVPGVASASQSAAASAHTGMAAVRPLAPPPDCGDTVYLTSESYNGKVFSFKIVGVGLKVWLGNGSGTMRYAGGVEGGSVQVSGSVNASGNGGARTSTLNITVSASQYVDIEASIYDGNYEACDKDFIQQP